MKTRIQEIAEAAVEAIHADAQDQDIGIYPILAAQIIEQSIKEAMLPTAREQARDKLVAAGEHLNFESRQILAAYSRLARAGVIDHDQWAAFSNSVEAQSLARAAYLATVTP